MSDRDVVVLLVVIVLAVWSDRDVASCDGAKPWEDGASSMASMEDASFMIYDSRVCYDVAAFVYCCVLKDMNISSVIKMLVESQSC